MSGRNRDIGRQYSSGSAKRKAKEEKERREELVIAKTQKLTHFFPAAAGSSQVDADVVPSAPTENCKEMESSCSNVTVLSENLSEEQQTVINFSTDISKWPKHLGDEAREYWISKGSAECQHSDSDFAASGRLYEKEKKPRFCQMSFFTQIHKFTNQRRAKHWLCYSESAGRLFCFPCKVMNANTTQFTTEGFNDWKNGTNLICRHEVSSSHRQAMILLLSRKDKGGRIDSQLVQQTEEERDYWHKVLQRIVETVRFLAERGLAFRGSDETVGSPHNGNYLGALELVSKFDPFLSEHINSHANKGKGHTSYLSKTTCEEFIDLMGTCVLDRIITEVKAHKFHSVSVDSTPDIAHIDQLTCILRYVLPSGPVERFVKFLDMQGHSGDQLAESLLNFLGEHGIDVKDCRGQSYDNACNMAGKYNGMQACIRQLNELAEYVPCAAHSLNLVGQFAAGCCQEAVIFFDFVQNIYTFFSASTYRWGLLTSALSEADSRKPVVKSMSDTRWSVRADATKALLLSFQIIKRVLDGMADDAEQKADCRQQARGLSIVMDKLETGILLVLWDKVLERFQMTSALLQSADQDLNTACSLYESLIGFVQNLRSTFTDIEQKAKNLTECSQYQQETKRVRRRNQRYDDQTGSTSVEDESQTPKEKFKTGTYIVIIDSLTASLSMRLGAYQGVASKFGFFRNLQSLPTEEITQKSSQLVKSYPSDLENGLLDEMVHFSELLKTNLGKGEDAANEEAEELRMYRLLMDNNLESCFPNVETALRIYLCLMISNCTGERTFSKLKRIKNVQRNTIGQKRLNKLSLMSIENELLRDIDMTKTIHQFACLKSRRHDMDLGNNNLVEVPKLKARHLRILYLENNQIKKIDVEAMRHYESLEHLSLKGNQIETIEDDTFIHNPRLFFLILNNNPLTKIHKRGLRGPTALQTLSLENTLIPELPSGYGISTLITLNIKQTPRLFTIPDPRKFTELQKVFVTFSMHCCAFRNKRRMEDLNNTGPCNTPAPTPNDVDNAGSHNSTEDDGGEFDHLYKGFFKEFIQSFNAKPVNNTPCEGELVGGPDIGAHLEVKCTPNPDAFNPCQDVMGTHLLRTFSWIISIFSILGNMFQLVILFHSRQELTVYKLLMYNLGFSNLLMGIYLMVLCCVDAYTYGVYYNYVHSWQYSGGCQTFGFLALFATQLSVCTLILITIERFLLIIFALQVGNQMTVRHAKIGIAIAWIYSFAVAFLPVTNTVSSYTMIAICLPLDVDSPVSEGYVVWLLLAYILAFFQIVFCYIRMYSSISEVRPGSSTNTIDIKEARRMSMIIFSNFLCWLPISIAGLMALYSKVEFNVSVAKFLLVFIFPLNACTNPFLYAIFTKVFRGDTLHLLSACGLFKKAEMEHQRGRAPSYFKSRSKERTNTNVSHFIHIQAPSTSCTYPNEHLERNIEAQAEFNSPETPLKVMIDPNNPHPLSKLERLHDEHNLPERLWEYEGERKPRSDSLHDLLEDADKKHLDQRFRSESNDTASTGMSLMSQISQVEYDEEFAKMIGSVQKSEGSILLS